MRGAFVDHLIRAPNEVASMKAGLAEKLRAMPDVFTLATCQRIEMYSIANPLVVDQARYGHLSLSAHADVAAALAHLVRVGAGLRSQIVGELEIRTQFERAVAKAEIDNAFRCLLEAILEESDDLRAEYGFSSDFGYDNLILERLLKIDPALFERSGTVAILGSGMLANQVKRRLSRGHGVTVELVGQRDRYPQTSESVADLIQPLRAWTSKARHDRSRLIVIATDLTNSSRRLFLETLARDAGEEGAQIVDFGAKPLVSEPTSIRRLPAGVVEYASMYDPWFQSLLDCYNPPRAELLRATRTSVDQATARLSPLADLCERGIG